jgi:pilus assembly protein CpaF
MLTVNIREKDGGERRLVFGTEEVTVGRAKGSDILLPRNNISKRHARFVDRDDKVVLVDLRSTNGTYVNGRRITAPEVVGPKDKIYIGDFVMKVESVKSPQHEHTMPQAPVSETAMMDPAPLEEAAAKKIADADQEGADAGQEGADAGQEDADAGQEDVTPEPNMDAELEVADPSTDPGIGANPVIPDDEEPSITPEDIFNEGPEEATAALSLAELGLSPDEAEEVGLAPTRHGGMSDDLEHAAEPESADSDPAESDEVAAEITHDTPEPDSDISFEEFEINLDDEFEPLNPAEDPPTRQADPPQDVEMPDVEMPDVERPDVERPTAHPDAPHLTAEAIDMMLSDVTVDGIQINSADSVAVRRGYAATVIPGAFESQGALEALAVTLAKRAGFDGLSDRMMDGALPGGIALHIIPTPLAPSGPIITLSRATAKTVSAADLVENGTLTDRIKEALEAAVADRKNIVIVGDRQGERSTMLSALSHLIPADARVALVEDSHELSVPQRNTMRLDKGALRDAEESFLDIVPRLNADRVLIDPISVEDIVEFIGLALGGHDGMMVTFQGRSAAAALRRMSLAVELSVGAALGERARDMVAEAVDLIVVIDHAEDGIAVREVITVDDAGPSGFRTSEILAYS